MTPSATPRGRMLETIRLGFMPLLDAAIPVIAAREGFAARHGIEIELVRETSWANIRDRVAIGHFDAAHVLGPMPVAAALGLTPHDVPLIAPMALGTGGNAITISADLWAELKAVETDLVPNNPVTTGIAMREALARRQMRGARRVVFGVVHPYSSHNYELRYWLSEAGIDPDRDVQIAILPPPYLPDALAAGRIDGFCVGEPWNTRAALRGDGRILLTKQAIWPDSPEKVLALRADWAERNPDLTRRLIMAMIEAARFCATPEGRERLHTIMAADDVLGTTMDELSPALSGSMLLADGERHAVPGMMEYASGHANQPDQDTARWYYSQMLRWHQLEARAGDAERAAASYRPDLYFAARDALGLGGPEHQGAPLASRLFRA